jgi:FtsP/CotA-like multicopper oxidase with cupredoxin domain
MALPNSNIIIPRRSIAGMEGMWAKMWDPPTESNPITPERLNPTNPVPDFVGTLIGRPPATPNTLDLELLDGLTLPAWDGVNIDFMTFGNKDIPLASGGTFPGTTIRVPRGVIFHATTKGKGPPPHTIHWHGMEPTPMNDGVGHTSMEIGDYTYQWQPNFIGSYFYHCHRNTVQHFEMGLYGFLIIEPPDAYTPGGGNNPGGYPRRTAANTSAFPQFPGFQAGEISPADPHAYTIPYDYEALWVCDDVDSFWHNVVGQEAKAFYPSILTRPGVDDQFFHGHFHDFNADYWYITGVSVDGGYQGSTGTIPPNVVVPMDLNSGVTGMQVSINAQTGKTILVRCLCASYNSMRVTFPVDVVIIAWDGRALGVPPFGRYSRAYKVPAGTSIRMSVARRFDALIRSTTSVNDFATVEFINTRGENVPGREQIVKTALIPIVIN